MKQRFQGCQKLIVDAEDFPAAHVMTAVRPIISTSSAKIHNHTLKFRPSPKSLEESKNPTTKTTRQPRSTLSIISLHADTHRRNGRRQTSIPSPEPVRVLKLTIIPACDFQSTTSKARQIVLTCASNLDTTPPPTMSE